MVDVGLGEVAHGIMNALSRIAKTIWDNLIKFKDTMIKALKYVWNIRKEIIKWIKFTIKMIYYKAKLVAYQMRPLIKRGIDYAMDNPHLVMLLPVVIRDIL